MRRARNLESTGLVRGDVLTALESEFPKQLPVILPRYEPAPLTEAIETETPEEATNFATARQRISELLHVPVVKRGVIMPDTCPSVGGRATIPVDGAIEVENAIIPGAHSADICCSMFATFFLANHPVGEMMDHGKGATPAWQDSTGRPLLGLIPLNMAREILLVLGADNDRYLAFCPHGAGRNLSRTAMLAPYKEADGELDPARVRHVLAATTAGLDIRWFGGAPDLSESPLGYKDATKVKAQIERFGLATVVGEIQPQGCIMAGEAPEPHWVRARREKRALHKAARREGAVEVGET